MAEKANRRSENLTESKTRSMEHLTVYCAVVEWLIRSHRCAFHQGQGHRDPHRKVGYMAAACPFRIEKLLLQTGAMEWTPPLYCLIVKQVPAGWHLTIQH